MIRTITIALLTLAVISCQNQITKADLVIQNASIWTGDINLSSAESMAISGDRILFIGANQEIEKFIDKGTEIINLQGMFVSPGFIDSHVHVMTGGRSLLSVDLRDARTPEEFTKRITEFAKTTKPGEWILEGNWDHTLWGGELPKKEWIDESTEDNPVVVFRLDWHMLLANSQALKYAGIDKSTPEVSGGTIVRDENGHPTGVLKDNAMNLLLEKIPPMTEAQKESAFSAAMNYFLENGVTSVHDVDGFNLDFESYSTANKFRESGDLSIRIYAAGPLNQWKEISEKEIKNDNWLKIGGLKGFVDGSLGSHTAAFKLPYTDSPQDTGLFINSEEELYQWVSNADRTGLQVMVHAIGDDAIFRLLNVYEQVINENGKRDRRFRVEHAQHLSPEDITRFADLGIVASMQPYHAIDDGRWAEEYIGKERIKTTYAFKSLLDANALIVFGSDWAVAPASPIQGIYAAVTRRTLDGKNTEGWVPEQKITAEQALIAYTRNAAYASFDESVKGSLEVGKLADFVVLSQNPLTSDPADIKNIHVHQTYVGGKKVFERN